MNPQLYDELKKVLRDCKRNNIVETLYREFSVILCHGDDSTLPQVIELSTALGIARQTVRKVYRQLELNGIISRGARFYYSNIKQRLNLFGVILPTTYSDFFRLGSYQCQYRTLMYSGMTDRAMELGCSVVPLLLPPPEAKDDVISAMLNDLRRYRGIIHVGTRGVECDRPLQALLNDPLIPQVSFLCELSLPKIGAVIVDSQQIADSVVQYLHELGHHRIGVIHIQHRESEKNCQDIMGNYALAYRSQLIKHFTAAGLNLPNLELISLSVGDDVSKRLEIALDEILNTKEPPTAFWCRNDSLAFATMNILRQHGIKVPQDISVMGFNDVDSTGKNLSLLTSVRCPFYEMGRGTIDHLEYLLNNGISAENRVKKYSTMLIARKSVSSCNLIHDEFHNLEYRY